MNWFWVHHTRPEYTVFCDFLASRIWGYPATLGNGTIMAVAAGNSLVAGVLFHNWDQDAGAVELTVAGDNPRWLTRAVLAEIGRYTFTELGCQVAVMRADPENARVARILRGVGFDRYEIPRLRGRNKGEAIYLLTDEVWQAKGFHKEVSNGT